MQTFLEEFLKKKLILEKIRIIENFTEIIAEKNLKESLQELLKTFWKNLWISEGETY